MSTRHREQWEGAKTNLEALEASPGSERVQALMPHLLQRHLFPPSPCWLGSTTLASLLFPHHIKLTWYSVLSARPRCLFFPPPGRLFPGPFQRWLLSCPPPPLKCLFNCHLLREAFPNCPSSLSRPPPTTIPATLIPLTFYFVSLPSTYYHQ